MDPGAAIIEAEVDLDGLALQTEQRRRHQDSARLAATVAKGGVETPTGTREHDNRSEQSRLLDTDDAYGSSQEEDERRPSWLGSFDFSHLPWNKRPSVFWVIGPFFFMACAFGGIITPKLNLILDLVCREYMSEQVLHHPGFTMIPVDFNNGNNSQCRIPEVQSRVSIFTLWGGLISGVLAAITSPKLGALSDRYGRKPVLIATSIGTVAGEVITLFAAQFPESFPVSLLLLSYALDGLTGSFIVAMSISNAYGTDCTPPEQRNVVFGYFHASLFSGIAIGPIVAGYIVKWTGKLVSIFYVLIVVHVCFISFVAFVVPESLSEKRQLVAREKHKNLDRELGSNWDLINQLRHLNILEPLKILQPTGPGSSPALRWNLGVLAAVDTIIFGVALGAMTVVIIYLNIQFGWQAFEAGRFLTIVNSCRVFSLLVVLPALTRLVRRKPDRSRPLKNSGCDWFDLAILRVSILLETLGFLGYTLSRDGATFTLAGAVASAGGIGSPTLQSALTKHIPADRTGQLLGAIGLLHALARVVAPVVFNAIYSATVKSYRQTVFVCLCATFCVAFLISWFIKPGVFYDEDHDRLPQEEEADNTMRDAESRNDHVPIVTAVNEMYSRDGS